MIQLQGQIRPIDEADRFATETIRICHLTRRPLRDDRARTIIRVRKCVLLLRLAQQAHNALAEHSVKQLLDDYMAADAVYAGAARAVWRDPEAFLPQE